MRTCITFALCLAFSAALAPVPAFAADGTLQPTTIVFEEVSSALTSEKAAAERGSAALEGADTAGTTDTGTADATDVVWETVIGGFSSAASTAADGLAQIEHAKTTKLLAYDPAAIAAIGSQEESGHTICCPSYACAYADAVLDGTVHDHDYYTCSCCTWTDWGGGGSSFRSVGTDEELLREAYDQIAAGRPTVIHVSWSGGEHWIALIGYENAADPDHLTLDNFIALDPWDGAQLNAGSKYELYGDGCEHVSDR